MNFQEITKLPAIIKKFTYSIHRGPDGKIYNVDLRTQKVLYVRDPHTTKYKVGDIVLSKDEGEYAEILEVRKDNEWGNHQYDIHFFNILDNYRWRSENELEPT